MQKPTDRPTGQRSNYHIVQNVTAHTYARTYSPGTDLISNMCMYKVRIIYKQLRLDSDIIFQRERISFDLAGPFGISEDIFVINNLIKSEDNKAKDKLLSSEFYL